jgi:phage terminase large subunit
VRPGETTALHKILALKKRLCIVQGGSSGGKTYAILLILIDRAQCEKNKIISVVSETVPHLKRGAIRDFLGIMELHGYYNDARWNKTDFIYTFETGSKIEFFSADSPDKVRGPRRDVLFINEANNISFDTYTQLVIRTNEDIYIDYNPVSEFWVHTEIIPKLEHDFIILTYRDNEQLSPSIVQEIESRREQANFWKVYGLGELGSAIGKIYDGWAFIDELPHEARLECYGLDLGYTNDPTAIVGISYYNGGYIWDEICYQKGLSNKQIADILQNSPKALVLADSAEPKSIDEIKSFGVNIVPAIKGQGSVNQRIQMVQGQRISVTKRSVNIIKEYRNYMWKLDNDNKPTNTPEHIWSHSMDAGGYGMSGVVPIIRRKEYIASLPIFEQKKPTNPAR